MSRLVCSYGSFCPFGSVVAQPESDAATNNAAVIDAALLMLLPLTLFGEGIVGVPNITRNIGFGARSRQEAATNRLFYCNRRVRCRRTIGNPGPPSSRPCRYQYVQNCPPDQSSGHIWAFCSQAASRRAPESGRRSPPAAACRSGRRPKSSV